MSQRASPVSATATSPRPRLAVKRAHDPPRNQDGNIFCDHPDCRGDPPVFRRPCEWNKHMDKHDRPYKCNDPDCAKLPGFTYSGGLLRHQREVHRMHTQGKKLMCPYSDCNRSSGKGFTRQENLKEHIRRLHRSEDLPLALNNTTLPPLSRTSSSTIIIAGISAPVTIPSVVNDPRVLPPISLPVHHPPKRKRTSATSSVYVSEEEERLEVRALRDECLIYARARIQRLPIDELKREWANYDDYFVIHDS
ncbi:conserved hypothetical protein [Microsporum canis CBS 113480]|uniref:C2H2-type domain-containing protein n=1 Tax=Arthroderma otae (strain ATCC MYA-4605 / CBS 113480) TaxID=554155 RepID=C5FWG9_ARTOC|nr:conserved hypothetical protein [Microsporum canis CBS 113480]EEQ34253.1 conserved hypothetical protein [Microsporum canis CBS 113480]